MPRLEDTKARLERILGRFEAAALRMQVLQQDNWALRQELETLRQSEALLRSAASAALAEVDQAIAIIAGQASTQGEAVEKETDLSFGHEGLSSAPPPMPTTGPLELSAVSSLAESLQPDPADEFARFDAEGSDVPLPEAGAEETFGGYGDEGEGEGDDSDGRNDDDVVSGVRRAQFTVSADRQDSEDSEDAFPQEQEESVEAGKSGTAENGGSWSYLDD